MASISGVLKVGEASATAGAVGARQRGSSFIYYGLLYGLVLAGAVLGVLAGPFLGFRDRPNVLDAVVGATAGAVIYRVLCRPLVLARFRGEFRRRQKTLDLPLRLELGADHLIYEMGAITSLVRWSAVEEVFRSRGYWIFLAQASACFAPKRFFASEEEEKRFVSEALSHMSSEARARSSEAERFSSGGDVA